MADSGWEGGNYDACGCFSSAALLADVLSIRTRAARPALFMSKSTDSPLPLHRILQTGSRNPFFFQASPFRQADSTMISLS